MELNQKINLVEELINQKDPDSINWNFRVGCVYRLFRIYSNLKWIFAVNLNTLGLQSLR